MSLATDGDYDDDLGHGYIRRPISVAQLLEREGYRPAARSRATRRALTGVAAGAVLALGAVVGSLLLNHASGNTAGDTLASGAGGNEIVLGNHQPAVSTYPKNAAQQQTSTGSVTQPQAVAVPNEAAPRVQTHPKAPVVNAAPVVPQSSQSAPAASSAATSTTTTAPSTSATSTTPATNAPVQPAPAPATTTSPTQASGQNGNNGGLLNTVTGTLTGTLDSVTQPVFNWFGN